MGILMGDVRRKGVFKSMLTDIVKPGQLEQIIIKMQHNCVSDGRSYAHKNFVPLVHEYIMVLKKLSPYLIDFSLPQRYETDIRDSKSATWKDVIMAVMHKVGTGDMGVIYAEIEGNKKTNTNPHWKDKVRQELQMLRAKGLVKNVERGVWAVA